MLNFQVRDINTLWKQATSEWILLSKYISIICCSNFRKAYSNSNKNKTKTTLCFFITNDHNFLGLLLLIA